MGKRGDEDVSRKVYRDVMKDVAKMRIIGGSKQKKSSGIYKK